MTLHKQESDRQGGMRGFTLPEILVALAIGLIVLVAASDFFAKQLTLYVAQDQVMTMRRNARAGLKLLLREARMAGYDPTDSSGAGVTVATASSFGFTTDLNGDGDVADSGENILYTLVDLDNDGDLDLGRQEGNATDLVSENIPKMGFVYVLKDGTETTTPADPNDIRELRLTLKGQTVRNDLAFGSLGGHHHWTTNGRSTLPNMALRED